MARRPCATRSPRRSRPSLTSCVDRSPGTRALRCHSTLNCGLTLAWLCTSVNLTARGSVAATRTPTACYVSTSRRAQISPDTPPTISLLSLPTSTAALARPSDGRPPPRRSTSIYYRFNQPALRRPLESALFSVITAIARHVSPVLPSIAPSEYASPPLVPPTTSGTAAPDRPGNLPIVSGRPPHVHASLPPTTLGGGGTERAGETSPELTVTIDVPRLTRRAPTYGTEPAVAFRGQGRPRYSALI